MHTSFYASEDFYSAGFKPSINYFWVTIHYLCSHEGNLCSAVSVMMMMMKKSSLSYYISCHLIKKGPLGSQLAQNFQQIPFKASAHDLIERKRKQSSSCCNERILLSCCIDQETAPYEETVLQSNWEIFRATGKTQKLSSNYRLLNLLERKYSCSNRLKPGRARARVPFKRWKNRRGNKALLYAGWRDQVRQVN